MAQKPTPPANALDAPAPIDRTDIAVLAGLPVLSAIAWLVPQASWPALSRGLAGIGEKVQGGSLRALAAHMEAAAGAYPLPRPAQRIARDSVACQVESNLPFLRAYRPGGWRPQISIDGLDHLADALAAGKGAVLWVDYFAFASLVAKVALHDAGHPLHHLSHPRHGFSATRFGMRWLNPVPSRIEDRYLAERVMLSLSGAGRALRTLQARLEEGRPVSFSARPTGSQVIDAPFLDGVLPLASGAPALAHSAGAPLLPLSVVRTGAGRFAVAIEPPLPLDHAAPRREAVPEAARAYARRLEPAVLRHPEQWQSWKSVVVGA